MTKKEFAKLGKQLLPELPGFSARGQLLYLEPVGHTLRGVFFDSSSFSANLFFAHVFLQPLFVPATHIGLNLGWRLGGGSKGWDIKAPNLVLELKSVLASEALPFLSRIRSVQDVIAAVHSLHKSADPYAQQAIAYAWARLGSPAQAFEALQRLVRGLDVRVLWQREMAERAEYLSTQLRTNPEEARTQLESWESETLANLKLESERANA